MASSSSSSYAPSRLLLILSIVTFLPLAGCLVDSVAQCEGEVINNQDALKQIKEAILAFQKSASETSVAIHKDIFAIFWCRPDLTKSFCRSCLDKLVHMIDLSCEDGVVQARALFGDFCYLRFAMTNFIGEVDISLSKVIIDETDKIVLSAVQRVWHWKAVVDLLRGPLKKLTFHEISKYYGVDTRFGSGALIIYAHIFCSRDLNETQCRQCVDIAVFDMYTKCGLEMNCMFVSPSCVVKYYTDHFHSELRRQILH